MKSKFKIGDEIYYMGYDKPRKEIIKGIAVISGIVEFGISTYEGLESGPSILYSFGYCNVEESKVFATKKELIDNLFSNL
jgi:hypothetical protein